MQPPRPCFWLLDTFSSCLTAKALLKCKLVLGPVLLTQGLEVPVFDGFIRSDLLYELDGGLVLEIGWKLVQTLEVLVVGADSTGDLDGEVVGLGLLLCSGGLLGRLEAGVARRLRRAVSRFTVSSWAPRDLRLDD